MALFTGRYTMSWSGSETWLLIAETLSVKNEASMFVVSREEVGGES